MDIFDSQIPLVAPTDFAAWAFLNLILVIATFIALLQVIIVALIRRFGQNDNAEKKEINLIFFASSVVVFVISVVLFFVTQDITLPIVIFDAWTIAFAILFMIMLAVSILSLRRPIRKNTTFSYPNTAA